MPVLKKLSNAEKQTLYYRPCCDNDLELHTWRVKRTSTMMIVKLERGSRCYETTQFVIEDAVNVLPLYTVQNVGTGMTDNNRQVQTQNVTTDNTLAESQIKTSLNATDILQRPDFLSELHIGRLCVVIYDKIPYPGEILNVDEVEVSCMKSLGRKKVADLALKRISTRTLVVM